MARLRGLSSWAQDETTAVRRDEALADRATLTGILEGVFRNAAEAGAILVEIRFGSTAPPEASLLHAFRAAEATVQAEHPGFVAEAVLSGFWPARARAREVLEACLQLVAEGCVALISCPSRTTSRGIGPRLIAGQTSSTRRGWASRPMPASSAT